MRFIPGKGFMGSSGELTEPALLFKKKITLSSSTVWKRIRRGRFDAKSERCTLYLSKSNLHLYYKSSPAAFYLHHASPITVNKIRVQCRSVSEIKERKRTRCEVVEGWRRWVEILKGGFPDIQGRFHLKIRFFPQCHAVVPKSSFSCPRLYSHCPQFSWILKLLLITSVLKSGTTLYTVII